MHLPEPTHITRPDGAHWTLELQVPVDHPRFAGHFPGLPILPGVVQLDWAARLGQQLVPELSAGPPCTAVEQLKFQAVVTPGATLRLSLAWNAQARQLSFEFKHGERVCSSGRLHFGASA